MFRVKNASSFCSHVTRGINAHKILSLILTQAPFVGPFVLAMTEIKRSEILLQKRIRMSHRQRSQKQRFGLQYVEMWRRVSVFILFPDKGGGFQYACATLHTAQNTAVFLFYLSLGKLSLC